MEKKGDLLNQLALIVDLVERLNLTFESGTIILDLKEQQYNETFDYVNKKYNTKPKSISDKFTVKMGQVEIVFNKNSDGTTQTS